jgi:fumarate hydratase class II
MLSDICKNFTQFCILGIKVNKEKVKGYLENALTLATILNPVIGYDKATKMAHYAYDKNISLIEANRELKFLPEDKMKEYLKPEKMIINIK